LAFRVRFPSLTLPLFISGFRFPVVGGLLNEPHFDNSGASPTEAAKLLISPSCCIIMGLTGSI
jgi:hypothetical protein